MDHDDDGDGGGGAFTFAVLRPLPGGGVVRGVSRRIDASPLMYPLFGRPRSPPRRWALEAETEPEPTAPTVTMSLRQLLLVDRGLAPAPVSSTSCHCPVCPGSPAAAVAVAATSQPRCRKSGSTGSAVLRWRQRLVEVGRSHSDGKEKFVFLDGDASRPSSAPDQRKARSGGAGGGHAWSWYAKHGNCGRRRTFLPYRQDLVGLFGYATAFRRSYHPF